MKNHGVFQDGKFVWLNEEEYAQHCAERAGSRRRAFEFMADTPGHKSPITGEYIEGRVARREHMKVHNVREVDPGERPNHRYTHPKRQHMNRD